MATFLQNDRAAHPPICDYGGTAKELTMANGLENLITRTRIMAGLSKSRELNDRQLLEEFADGDETAFTALVDRYGGLVMGVCRRILQHTQDAEDAFQAPFMVLARKAGKIAWQDSV